MKLKFLVLTLFTFLSAFAQEKATVTGTVTDQDMDGAPLAFASVTIKGTLITTNTNENGTYTLTTDPGTFTVVFDFIGYDSKEVEVTVAAGETTTLNQEIGTSSVELENVVIETTVNREKESALLAQQKDAMEMKQAIGSQELTRKGVNDAAAAVIKTAGVSKQEGVKNVFVRGLGDRYNSTTLNGLPVPSEDPLYKNISLDFFQTNIIKNININKTFGSTLYGDNSGANIDISSKELEKSRLFSFSAGAGFNTNAISASNFAVSDGAYSYFGFLQNGRNAPITNLNQYTFNSSFKSDNVSTPINTNFNVVAGGKFNVGKGNNTLSLFGVANNISEYYYRKGLVGQVTNAGDYQQRLDMNRSDYKTTQSFLGNAKFKHDKGSVSLNSLYIHNNSQFVGNYLGYDWLTNSTGTDYAQNHTLFVRQQNNDNQLLSNQLLADYKFSDHLNANIGATYSTMRGTEPDRKTNTYAMTGNGDYALSAESAGANNRYFSTLDENDFGAKGEVQYTVNPEANAPIIVTAGGNYRKTDRTFNFIEFDYLQNGLVVDPSNPDAVLNQQHLDLTPNQGGFDLLTLRGAAGNANALNPMFYIGHRQIGAGYAQLLYPVSEKLTLQVGIRDEQVKQTITWDTNITSTVTDLTTKPSLIDKNYLLPSLNLKYTFSEKDALRFAASKTYTMPQFKEMANFLYSDINFNERGNPYLTPSTVYNFDLKYDYYLSKKEIISVGGFYKYIQDPILRMIMNTPGLDYSYVNTNKAYVAGAEAEVRKTLYGFDSETRNNDLSFGLNASYLYSQQTQEDVTTGLVSATFTNHKGKMQGASPLLVNADLSFNTSNENSLFMSTVVFNYFYDKVYSVGTGGRENIIEKSVPTLDFVNHFELKKHKLTMSLAARNILNPKFRLTQSATSNVTGETHDLLISSYRKGAVISLGLNWQL